MKKIVSILISTSLLCGIAVTGIVTNINLNNKTKNNIPSTISTSITTTTTISKQTTLDANEEEIKMTESESSEVKDTSSTENTSSNVLDNKNSTPSLSPEIKEKFHASINVDSRTSTTLNFPIKPNE